MNYGITTSILHSDSLAGAEHGAVHKPMHTAAAYAYSSSRDLAAVFQGSKSGFVYARQGNPTGAALEAKISLLEDARATACFSTGMAAIAAVLISLLRAGDHIVSSQFLFGNTNSLLQTLQGMGIEVSFVDATDAAHVAAALRPNTRLVFVETIANPRTQVTDLDGIGRLCADRRLLYVVDSTLTPILFRARDVRAGLVVHALTKGIGGHGNAMGGAVCDTGLFDWASFDNILPVYKKGDAAGWGMLQIRKKGLRDLGATLRAEDAHRIAVGAETLVLRSERACDNAIQLARWLEAQPQVQRVYYPGLQSHAEHTRAATLFKGGFGTLLAFELRTGIDCFDFLDALKLVIVSSHLSDTRTLAIPVAHTIFWEMGPERRQTMGIADGLIRLSVGIEDLADLRGDIAQALGQFPV
ncbi:MAG: cystathionine gamma-synthase family protein [Stenotrophobium sp.]